MNLDDEPFDEAVHLDRYRLDDLVARLAETADEARSAWETLRRSGRQPMWEGEDYLFNPAPVDELEALVFEASQTAEIAWKLLDEANLDYYRRFEAHEEAQGDDE